MKTVEASEIVAMLQSGAKLFIGRDSSGQPKVKIVRGPFGLFVSRFSIDEQQCELLKSKLGERSY